MDYYFKGKAKPGRPKTTLPVKLMSEYKVATNQMFKLDKVRALAENRDTWDDLCRKVLKAYGLTNCSGV